MAKFQITEVTDIRATYIVEAKDAPSAINKVKRREFESSSHQSVEQQFVCNEVKEEQQND